MIKNNNINFKIEHFLKSDYLEQMIKLDSDSYDQIDMGTYDTCMSWYRVNNDMYTILLIDEMVVGYINFIPLNKHKYDEFRMGKTRDSELTSNDITSFVAGNIHSCLLMSVVIKREFRNGDAVKILTQSWLNKLRKFKENNIYIDRIVADCVSKDGEKYIEKLGFSKVCVSNHNTLIYEKVY